MGPRILYIHRYVARAGILFGLASALVGTTSTSHAEPTQKEIRQARATFRAGLALEAAGDFKAALVKFRDVAEVRQTPQVTFHIARCLENLGRWTEALGTYRMTIDTATAAGVDDVVESAEQARQDIEARMPKLKVVRGPGAAGAVVQLDGVRIGATSFGVEMPADPGDHRVVATIDGKERFSKTVVLEEGRVETVSITIESKRSPVTPVEPETQPGEIGPSERTGYIFLGAGITSVVVGGMFLKLRADTMDLLEEQCVGGHCHESLESTSNRGKIYTMAANAFLGAGVVSAGIGTVILVQNKSEPENPEGAPATPPAQVGLSAVGPGGATGATLWGKF